MATPTVLSFTMQDDNGVKASAPFYASYDGAVETIDALIGEWLVLGALIDAVTGAKIVSGHIEIPLARDAAWKAAPINGDGVEQTLALSFSNDDTIYNDTFNVPALRETLVDSQGKPILTAAGAIDNLADALAGSFTNGYFVNSSGSDLIALVAAFQATRKQRRQLKARSTVIA
jgi:hypothetical protein